MEGYNEYEVLNIWRHLRLKSIRYQKREHKFDEIAKEVICTFIPAGFIRVILVELFTDFSFNVHTLSIIQLVEMISIIISLVILSVLCFKKSEDTIKEARLWLDLYSKITSLKKTV